MAYNRVERHQKNGKWKKKKEKKKNSFHSIIVIGERALIYLLIVIERIHFNIIMMDNQTLHVQ